MLLELSLRDVFSLSRRVRTKKSPDDLLERSICGTVSTTLCLNFGDRSTCSPKKADMDEGSLASYYLSKIATSRNDAGIDVFVWRTDPKDVSWSKRCLRNIELVASWFDHDAVDADEDDDDDEKSAFPPIFADTDGGDFRIAGSEKIKSGPSPSSSPSSSYSSGSETSLEASLERIDTGSSFERPIPEVGERSRLNLSVGSDRGNRRGRAGSISRGATDENLRRFEFVESIRGPVCAFVRAIDMTLPLDRWIEYADALARAGNSEQEEEERSTKIAEEILKVYVCDLHLEKIRFYNDFSLECNRGAPLVFFLFRDKSSSSSPLPTHRGSIGDKETRKSDHHHSSVSLVKTIYHLFRALDINDETFPRIARPYENIVHLCLCDATRRDFFTLNQEVDRIHGGDDGDGSDETATFDGFDEDKDDLFFQELRKVFSERLGLHVVSDAFLANPRNAGYLEENRKKKTDRVFIHFVPFRDFRKKTTSLCLSYYLGSQCKKTYSKCRVFETTPFLSAYNVIDETPSSGINFH
jgi:hypothetical protein